MLTPSNAQGPQILLVNTPIVDRSTAAVIVGGRAEDAQFDGHGQIPNPHQSTTRVERVGTVGLVDGAHGHDGRRDEGAQANIVASAARTVEDTCKGRGVGGHGGDPRPSTRVGPRQRVDEAIAHEATVMHFLAEVAAVGQGATPIWEGAPQRVVTPLPHKTSRVAGVAHLRSVAGCVSGAGSHRVQVFAHEIGGLADALACRIVNPRRDVGRHGHLGAGIAVIKDGRDFLEGGVHARVDVRVLQGVVAFVVDDRTVISTLVDPTRTGDQVRAVSRLVAQAPAHDRRMILVAFEGADRAIQVCVGPARIVGGVVDPLPRSLESVGLDVSFEHDPQADLVGQGEHTGVRRIVGGANRVDPHGFHER